MFTAYYDSPAYDPTSSDYHHASIRERIEAARYISPHDAARVLLSYTDIPTNDAAIWRRALAAVRSSAKDMQEAKATDGDYCPFDIIWNGLSVPEQLAQRAVDCVNELLFEAMAS